MKRRNYSKPYKPSGQPWFPPRQGAASIFSLREVIQPITMYAESPEDAERIKVIAHDCRIDVRVIMREKS